MERPPAAGAPDILVVDLDRTLLRTDLLVEQVLAVIKTRPTELIRALVALLKSYGNRAVFKEIVARAADVDVPYLPYRESVLALIDAERRAGVTVVLASASHQTVVSRIARHLSRFDHALGSGDANLTGRAKLDAIRGVLGHAAFAYVGVSPADRVIWSESQRAVAVNPSRPLLRWLKSRRIPVTVLKDEVPLIPVLLKQLRAYQWVKNLLVFVPLVAAHRFLGALDWGASVLAFVSFSCLASAGYCLNDMADFAADRRHPSKNDRPLASGALSARGGLVLAAALLVLAGVGAAFLPRSFSWTVAAYFIVALSYSFWFKRLLALDIVLLTALYGIRVLAGGAATGIQVPSWLLVFLSFLFFGLAALKLFAEIASATPASDIHSRGYRLEDAQAVLGIGIAGSLLAVLGLGLYLNSEVVNRLYGRPRLLWLLAPLLLYWISRLWILASRDEVHQDPMVFASRDRVTWIVVLLALAIILFAA
jgi:4-hydroxybenzoate polyprenyltransferase